MVVSHTGARPASFTALVEFMDEVGFTGMTAAYRGLVWICSLLVLVACAFPNH